jgi:hypothetical protein
MSGVNMKHYSEAARERTMKVQDVMLQAFGQKDQLVAGGGDPQDQ